MDTPKAIINSQTNEYFCELKTDSLCAKRSAGK